MPITVRFGLAPVRFQACAVRCSEHPALSKQLGRDSKRRRGGDQPRGDENILVMLLCWVPCRYRQPTMAKSCHKSCLQQITKSSHWPAQKINDNGLYAANNETYPSAPLLLYQASSLVALFGVSLPCANVGMPTVKRSVALRSRYR